MSESLGRAVGAAGRKTPKPVVTKISPTKGSTAGGTRVTITGKDLAKPTSVHFGAKAATIRGHTGTTTIVRSPKGTGTVDVTVTTAGGTSAKVAGDKFKYVAPPPKPSVTKVVPTNGPLGEATPSRSPGRISPERRRSISGP